jgi:hypothetical protein
MNVTIYLQAHFNCMVMLVLLVVIAFIIIFIEVGGYSKVSNIIMDDKDIFSIQSLLTLHWWSIFVFNELNSEIFL